MALARETFHFVLRIIYKNLYRDSGEDKMSESQFIKEFERDLLEEKPKGDKDKYYYPLASKSNKTLLNYMSGGHDFPKSIASHMCTCIDKGLTSIIIRLKPILKSDYDLEIFISDFERHNIPIDRNDVPGSIILIIRKYLNAIDECEEDPFTGNTISQKCYHENGILHMNGKTFDIADITENNYESVPNSKHEQEILKVFNAENEEQLSTIDKEFMTLQRIAYTTAECNRNNLRDCIEDGEPIYQKFIDEVKKGIQPTYMNSDFENGRQRMRNVLSKSTDLAITNNLKDTPLSDSDNRQGICHILIDEDKYFEKGWEL